MEERTKRLNEKKNIKILKGWMDGILGAKTRRGNESFVYSYVFELEKVGKGNGRDIFMNRSKQCALRPLTQPALGEMRNDGQGKKRKRKG